MQLFMGCAQHAVEQDPSPVTLNQSLTKGYPSSSLLIWQFISHGLAQISLHLSSFLAGDSEICLYVHVWVSMLVCVCVCVCSLKATADSITRNFREHQVSCNSSCMHWQAHASKQLSRVITVEQHHYGFRSYFSTCIWSLSWTHTFIRPVRIHSGFDHSLNCIALLNGMHA